MIPILLEGAEMPREAELPVEIRALAEHNALRLRDGDWSYDIDRILGTLEKVGFKARQPAAADGAKTAGQSTPARRASERETRHQLHSECAHVDDRKR